MLEPQKKVGLCSPNVAAVKGLPITEEITHREQIANHNIQNKKKTAERIYFISGIPWFGRDAENSQGNTMANEYFQVLKFKPRVKTIINTYMVTLLPTFKKTLNSIFTKFQTLVCTASYCKATAHGWKLRSLPKVRTGRSDQSFLK